MVVHCAVSLPRDVSTVLCTAPEDWIRPLPLSLVLRVRALSQSPTSSPSLARRLWMPALLRLEVKFAWEVVACVCM